MRLNIPSAAFAKSSFSVDPYARIPTSAVCSVSSYRTGRPNALEDESPAVLRVRSEPLKLGAPTRFRGHGRARSPCAARAGAERAGAHRGSTMRAVPDPAHASRGAPAWREIG